MKKIFIVLALALFLSACSFSQKPNTDGDKTGGAEQGATQIQIETGAATPAKDAATAGKVSEIKKFSDSLNSANDTAKEVDENEELEY